MLAEVANDVFDIWAVDIGPQGGDNVLGAMLRELLIDGLAGDCVCVAGHDDLPWPCGLKSISCLSDHLLRVWRQGRLGFREQHDPECAL